MIVLAVAKCATCNAPIKGYVNDNDAAQTAFRHVSSVATPHAATPTKETFRPIPPEVWHAIAIFDQFDR